jgi:hypothetical protein
LSFSNSNRSAPLRRSLSHLGGQVETHGDGAAARFLAAAMQVESAPAPTSSKRFGEDDTDRRHVHGFHTYPARMHPDTAARLVGAFSEPNDAVFDPFCGSGTVLVETMIAGRQAIGTDLNPLAVMLTRSKTYVPKGQATGDLMGQAAKVAAHAEKRRKARAGASRRYPPEDVEAFEPHVLLELDGLRHGIESLGSVRERDDLYLILSAILVKVSRRKGDTSQDTEKRRLGAGYTSKLFVRKAEEYVRRRDAFYALVPPSVRRARVSIEDATQLRSMAEGTFDLVVSSPPYVATYDYLEHHAMRMRWLGLDTRSLAAGEMGARRRFSDRDPTRAKADWNTELGRLFAALARTARPNALVVLLMADSAVGGEAVPADVVVPHAAAPHGWNLVARASQTRPHFHGPTAKVFSHKPRKEHLLLLGRRGPTPSKGTAAPTRGGQGA